MYSFVICCALQKIELSSIGYCSRHESVNGFLLRSHDHGGGWGVTGLCRNGNISHLFTDLDRERG